MSMVPAGRGGCRPLSTASVRRFRQSPRDPGVVWRNGWGRWVLGLACWAWPPGSSTYPL